MGGGTKKLASASVHLSTHKPPPNNNNINNNNNNNNNNSTYGASSALSVIVGSLGTFGTGVILDEFHDWGWVYGTAAGVYVAGAVAFAGLYKAHKIFD